MNHHSKGKNLHHVILSQFALEAGSLFACNLFERDVSGLMVRTTYFNGHEALYDDGPIASYNKFGGAVTLCQGNYGSMKLAFQLTLSQFSALQNYFSPWFSELLKDNSFCTSQCEATYPKWAMLPILRRSPAGYKITLRFNAYPTASFIQAILNVMAFMGYPLKEGNRLLKNHRSNLIMIIFGEVYAVRLWFGGNWPGGSTLRRKRGNNAAMGT